MLRLESPDPADRQIAILGLAWIESTQRGLPFYVGVCGCETSVQGGGVLIMSTHPEEHCLFCRQVVALTQIPPHREIMKRVQWIETP